MSESDAPSERPYRLFRRDRLSQLIEETGSASKLALLVETPKTHVSAILAGTRGMGDDLATKIESALDKPFGWLDQHDPLTLAKRAQGQAAASINAEGPIEITYCLDLLGLYLLGIDQASRGVAASTLSSWALNPEQTHWAKILQALPRSEPGSKSTDQGNKAA